jgi:hypothetical protein
MESSTNAGEVYPGKVYPASRPGYKFVAVVAVVAVALLGFIVLG